MKTIKIILFITITYLLSLNALAQETKKDCSSIKADTGVKMYKKWKCKMDIPEGEGIGKKLKNLFKKKN